MFVQTKEVKEISCEICSITIDGEQYFKISDNDAMRPFFMSIVSDSDHWMFIASNGGLTAGRKNADHALFPYYTEDKVTESNENTGSKVIVRMDSNGKTHLWEPFSLRSEGIYRTTRNLYKNTLGNKIIFEERNHSLQVSFQYQWSSSSKFGFVKRSRIQNDSESFKELSILDGLQNIMPSSVSADTQNSSSNLVDAYKRSELAEKAGLGLFALSAIIVDKAEPSEALKANVVWSFGLEDPLHLLSSKQLDKFRNGQLLNEEIDVKAEKGAYFINSEVSLQPGQSKQWYILADVNKDHSAIAELINMILSNPDIEQQVLDDIDLGTQKLKELIASSDGIQLSADHFRDARHLSNSLFNIMRGGVFDFNYQVEKWDFIKYLKNASKSVYEKQKNTLNVLPDDFNYFELSALAGSAEDADFKRLCLEYLPLKFSRRHGDPSRPWNKFTINIRNETDGSKILDYEGNWRDIFQNWEALSLSFPAFCDNMIHKFLNASTFEGYNPYRITKDGFDWETIEPDNPWSYIGYWGDHQIIYLLKLLEISNKHYPQALSHYFEDECFVYANVPYKIKNYRETCENPKDTIEFDAELDMRIHKRKENLGADATLMQDENGLIYKVNFIEKLLATVLAKLSNFIPEGGIWMNTQRPEWNDANNALVGNGVSVVTLCYLRRFLIFFKKIIEDKTDQRVPVSNELIIFYKKVRQTFEENLGLLEGAISNKERKTLTDLVGIAGSDYREHIYKRGFWGEKRTISYSGLKRFLDHSLKFIDHSIASNKRSDGLYHSYNLMTIENEKEISISHLSEMLEGQVAVLSSGFLSPVESLLVLDALKASALFRQDQYSYLLYPQKELAGFMFRNTIPAEEIKNSPLLTNLIEGKNTSVVLKDVNGVYHFNGNFKNAGDLKRALDELERTDQADLVRSERKRVLSVFEKVFNHKAFTGRSGTFYGYEGLGSIYWHMVSKLLVAVQEVCVQAHRSKVSEVVFGKLLEHYYEINEGLGVHKSPKLYGAFPTDPYSHTPFGKGAQQPGMTGQVKEDILCRFGELGVFVNRGKLCFDPFLLRINEFSEKPCTFNYINIYKVHRSLDLGIGSMAFTYCQVPVVYHISDKNRMRILKVQGSELELSSLELDESMSKSVFERKNEIEQIHIEIDRKILK